MAHLRFQMMGKDVSCSICYPHRGGETALGEMAIHQQNHGPTVQHMHAEEEG
jgi:hypothetical protein